MLRGMHKPKLPSQLMASQNPTQSSDMRSWVDQPNQRGTIDIIWNCLTTIAICCWAMIHLNVPAKTDSFWTLSLRKTKWLLLALMAPELVMLFACGQWASAQRSVNDMQSFGKTKWTLIHGFYADMGGFILRSDDYVDFPVTAKQVHYLVSQGHTTLPMISEKEIWDKSKADRFVKAVAFFQAIWLVAQVIARGIQHLAITPLELSTSALVTCAGATIFFWSHKPLNVETPTIIEIDRSLAHILLDAGEQAATPFKDTPLDFIEPCVYTSTQLPLNRLWGVQERPLPRLPNDRDSHLHNLTIVMSLALPTAAFSLLHLAAWNFSFPTKSEQLLWRWTCVSMGTVLGVGCTWEVIGIVVSNYTATGLTNLNSYKLKWPSIILFLVPGLVYMLARLIVLFELILSLRLLPATCFDTVQWSQLLPHI